MNTIQLSTSPLFALARISGWLILAILLSITAALWLPAAIWPAVLFAAYAFYRYFNWRAITYELSEETLKTHSGIFFKRTDSLELYRVKDYIITRNLLMQWFCLMNLELLTTDLTNPVTILRGIPKSDIAEIIRERVQTARQNNKILELN